MFNGWSSSRFLKISFPSRTLVDMGIVLLQEMQEVEQMLEFVAKRLNDAENVNWKGMFKKNPLW